MLTCTLLFVNSMLNDAVSWLDIPLRDWQLLLASQVSFVLKDCILYVRARCVYRNVVVGELCIPEDTHEWM